MGLPSPQLPQPWSPGEPWVMSSELVGDLPFLPHSWPLWQGARGLLGGEPKEPHGSSLHLVPRPSQTPGDHCLPW